MISVIKTAIITIIISFISGVLLDHYKNVAPRIVCHIGKCTSVRLRTRKIRAYILTVRNISKKTIHDLNLNLQASCEKFNIDDAKITNGLKFDISNEGNTYDVSIPFLSKNDEFSVKIFLEGSEGKIRPIIALRSPENFKRINSDDEDGFLNSIKQIPGNISEFFTNVKSRSLNNNAEKNFLKSKKVIITIASVILLIFAGVLTTKFWNTNSSQEVSTGIDNSKNENDSSGNSTVKPSIDSSNKSKAASKSENSPKNESGTGNETNSGGSSSNNSGSKSDRNKNSQSLSADSSKNKENNSQDKNAGLAEGSSTNGKSKESSKESSIESSAGKDSDSKSKSNETNKSIGQESGAKEGTSTSNTP